MSFYFLKSNKLIALKSMNLLSKVAFFFFFWGGGGGGNGPLQEWIKRTFLVFKFKRLHIWIYRPCFSWISLKKKLRFGLSQREWAPWWDPHVAKHAIWVSVIHNHLICKKMIYRHLPCQYTRWPSSSTGQYYSQPIDIS